MVSKESALDSMEALIIKGTRGGCVNVSDQTHHV